MDPKLSDSMPAQQDSQLPATFAATMESDAPPYAGEGGSPDAPVVAISRDSTQTDPLWVNNDDKGADWQTEDKKTGSEWEMTDRKEA